MRLARIHEKYPIQLFHYKVKQLIRMLQQIKDISKIDNLKLFFAYPDMIKLLKRNNLAITFRRRTRCDVSARVNNLRRLSCRD